MSQPSFDPVAAIAANHRHWFAAQADRLHADSFRDGDVAIYAGFSPIDECQLPFPAVDSARAGEQLDAALAFARSAAPQGSPLAWTAHDDRVLGVRLMARGLRVCFRPHWMWLDLATLPSLRPSATVEMHAYDDADQWTATPHPYFGTATLAATNEARMVADPAGDIIGVCAVESGRAVGAAVAHVADMNGVVVAGIYNVGVVEGARNRGIGGAVTAAVCRLAAARGAVFAGLNATPMGEPVYRRLGFSSVGWGQTWNTPPGMLGQPAVESALVSWTEAIGSGNIDELVPASHVLGKPLPCGLTPVQFAAYSHQPASLVWLLAAGAQLDPLSAWDIGWRDQIPAIVATDPSLTTFPTGEAGGNPLHQAVLRDDLVLVEALLAAGAQTDGQDPTYRATPLGWAEHMGREAIASTLRRHRSL